MEYYALVEREGEEMDRKGPKRVIKEGFWFRDAARARILHHSKRKKINCQTASPRVMCGMIGVDAQTAVVWHTR